VAPLTARRRTWRRRALAGAALLLAGSLGLALLGRQPEPRPRPSGWWWKLDSSEVGLAGAGVVGAALPLFTGEVKAGQTLRRVRITTPLDLSDVPGVTLDQVLLAPEGGRRALVLGPGTTVQNSDVDGSAMRDGERIGVYGNVDGRYALTGVSITGMSIGAWLDGPGIGTVTRTYIRDMISAAGAHVDGLTRRAGTGPLTIRDSRIDVSGGFVTAALFLQSTWGADVGGVRVVNSYLEGEGYVIRLEDCRGSPLQMTDVRVRSVGWGPIYTTCPSAPTGWALVTSRDQTQGLMPLTGQTR
jgi:hypothetical protein